MKSSRIAVVGSGIAGLAAAHGLVGQAEVTLFEAADYFGGHTHTVDVTLDGVSHGVDTGFLVFNERTYPNLIRLFATLGVATAPSEMSFSVQVRDGRSENGKASIEWSGHDLDAVFAQRRNLVRPGFWRMLRDLLRFNRLTTALAVGVTRAGADKAAAQAALDLPVEAFLAQHRFSHEFRDWYFLPMIACIWSCPVDQMLRFPMATMVRFCHNHGLLQITGRPQWHTVRGGARRYVEAMLKSIPDARLATPVRRIERHGDGVTVRTDAGGERFDEVVLACHSDQALALLAEPGADEAAVLGAIRYQRNRAVLHTDRSLLPGRVKAWAAWNYERDAGGGGASDESGAAPAVCLHYLLNRLQPLPFRTPVIVSLNPVREPRPDRVHAEFDYAHPVFDRSAIDAQARLAPLQGRRHTWFCGAWTGHGFHEDGLVSGMAVCEALQRRLHSESGRAAATAVA